MVEAVRSIANQLGISAYDEKKHRGILRHIMVRTGRVTNETMIVLITTTKQLPHAKALIKELTNTYPQIKSIKHNGNEKRTNVIFGPKTNLLWGEPYIYDSIGELRF